MHNFSKIQYPKLIALCVSMVSAYALFRLDFFADLAGILNLHGYTALFLGGMLFAFGFTAPFAVGIFLSVTEFTHPLFGAIIGGFGSALSDLFLFRFIRFSFLDECKKLQLSTLILKMKNLFHHRFSDRLKKYLLWTFAGFLIASPLPDEFGVVLLSGFTKMNAKLFAGIAFVLNTSGILTILLLGNL